jgi:hypothetical protein
MLVASYSFTWSWSSVCLKDIQHLHLYELLKIFKDILKMDPFNHTMLQ